MELLYWSRALNYAHTRYNSNNIQNKRRTQIKDMSDNSWDGLVQMEIDRKKGYDIPEGSGMLVSLSQHSEGCGIITS